MQRINFLLALILYFLAVNVITFAASGDLDQTFGTGGKVTTAIGSNVDISTASALQPDGKIILVGYTQIGFNNVFSMVRYNTNGSLDTTFGTGGKVTTDFEGSNQDVANAVTIQPDGKIVVAGYVISDNSSTNFALARYNLDGSLDTGFGNGGKVITILSSSNDEIRSLAVQSDGKIVAVGYAYNGNPTFNDFAIVRYNINGSLDTTFDSDGKVFTHFGNDQDEAFAAIIQLDGKIVVVGFADITNLVTGLALARYNLDGSLDSSFDSDGRVTTAITGSSYAEANAVVLQQNGKIVIAGRTFPSVDASVLARYNTDGSLDSSFDTDGIVLTSATGTIPVKLALQSNGKLVASGNVSGSSTNDFAVFRYNSNGSTDTSFGTSGRVTFFFGDFNIQNDNANAVLIQSDGKIIVSGYSGFDFALARLLGDSINFTQRANFDFDGDIKTDLSIFRPSNGQWWFQQSSDNVTKAFTFGTSTDKIVPADYDGDGKTDVAFFRPSTGEWFVLRSSNLTFYSAPFGNSTDKVAPGDFDGDGKADLAVFRQSQGTWYINKSTGGIQIVPFGISQDIPAVADYDGDGKADIAVFRPTGGSGNAEWWILRSSDNSVFATPFGSATDKPVPSDYTGDGKADVAFYRPTMSEWFVLRSENLTFYAAPFGTSTDVPVAGDYDGDGKSDLAVFRPSNATWFVLKSSGGTLIQGFGVTGDIPVPSAFVP